MAEVSIEKITRRPIKAVDLWTFRIGLFFLILFPLQAVLGWQPAQLAAWQSNDTYKMWSGVALTGYLGLQWVLPALRMTGRTSLVKRFYKLHKQAGAVAPVIFYIHAMEWGYAYLGFLTVVYFSNIAVGLFSQDVVGSRLGALRKQYTFYWMVTHVFLSVLTVGLTFYHIYIAFAYQ